MTVRPRADLPGLPQNPLYRDAVLLTLHECALGRREIVPRGDKEFRQALWHLRAFGLVAWNEATGQPDPVLTGLGWTLAERLAVL